jgi:hypothetical protein
VRLATLRTYFELFTQVKITKHILAVKDQTQRLLARQHWLRITHPVHRLRYFKTGLPVKIILRVLTCVLTL